MEIIRKLKDIKHISSSVVTLGSFDGIHNGHKEIIKTVIKYSKTFKIKSVLITYDPHPQHVLKKTKNKLSLLMGLDEKLEMLRALGLDTVYVISFSATFSKISPSKFLKNFVLEPFQPKYIIVGMNHHFGKNRKGNLDYLKSFCLKKEIILEPIDIVSNGGTNISSSHIRNLISSGHIRKANFELGRSYGFKGEIKRGNGNYLDSCDR